MFLRKFLALILIFIMALLSIPLYFAYSLDRTYFDENFYQQSVADIGYEYLIEQTNKKIYQENDLLKANFTEEEFQAELESEFTKDIFKEFMLEFSNNLIALVDKKVENLEIDLTFYRASLLTVVNNLVYKVYKKLPTCSEEEQQRFKFGTDIVNCVPAGVDYDIVMNPIFQSYENTVYKFPDKINNLENSIPLMVLQNFRFLKDLLFMALLFVISALALLLWRPFSTLLKWEGAGFLLSGVVGVFLSFIDFGWFSSYSAESEQFKLMITLLGLLMAEIRKLGIIFLIIAFSLLAIGYVVKLKMEKEKISFRR